MEYKKKDPNEISQQPVASIMKSLNQSNFSFRFYFLVHSKIENDSQTNLKNALPAI